MSTGAIGPFCDGDYYRLTVDGYEVPYLRAHLRKGTEDLWDILLDRRFGYELTDAELHKVLPLLANAMAIAAGYSCHGEHCRPTNPFQVRMIGVSVADTRTESEGQAHG